MNSHFYKCFKQAFIKLFVFNLPGVSIANKAKILYYKKESFGGRLVYVGLQGSWLRGEATENSDIDVMIVLDRLSVEDMKTYRAILKDVGWFEKSCGFICGKEDLANWNPLESLPLKYTTKDLFGKLENLLPPATRQDEVNYVKISRVGRGPRNALYSGTA